mgnify:CR=1 FL=1
MNNVVNSSMIGVNLQGVSDGATALFGVGQHCLGDDSAEWVYVMAQAAFTTGMLVAVNATYSAKTCTATDAFAGQQLAFAQGAWASSDFGWVALRGNGLNVALSTVCTLGVALYISAASSGSITTAAASGTLAGITILNCSATGVLNAASTAYVSWPRLSPGALFGV